MNPNSNPEQYRVGNPEGQGGIAPKNPESGFVTGEGHESLATAFPRPEVQQQPDQVNPELLNEASAYASSVAQNGANQPERGNNLAVQPPPPVQEAQFREPLQPPKTDFTGRKLSIESEISKKKSDARKLLVISITFALFFIVGIVVLVALTLGNESASISSSTDDKLRGDLNTFALGVINYNSGRDERFNITSESVNEFRSSYVPRDFKDPRTGESYVLTSEMPKEGDIQYITKAKCTEDDSIVNSDSDSDFAARIKLESGVLLCIERGEVTSQQPSR